MQVIQLVDSLFDAYQNRTALPKTTTLKKLTVNQAYHIQHAVTSKKVVAGERLVGYKLCLTNQNCLDLFNANEPIYGQMTSKQCLDTGIANQITNINQDCQHSKKSHDNETDNGYSPLATISLSHHVNDACIELDLAFIAKERLLVSDSIEQLCEKCLVAPCIEISDSRYEDWFANMSKEHLCADGAVGGYVCIGDAHAASYADITNFAGRLYHNDMLLSVEPASIVMKHPARALHWLINKLDEQGLHISANMFVASGAFGIPVTLTTGQYVGEIEQLGSVTLNVDA